MSIVACDVFKHDKPETLKPCPRAGTGFPRTSAWARAWSTGARCSPTAPCPPTSCPPCSPRRVPPAPCPPPCPLGYAPELQGAGRGCPPHPL